MLYFGILLNLANSDNIDLYEKLYRNSQFLKTLNMIIQLTTSNKGIKKIVDKNKKVNMSSFFIPILNNKPEKPLFI
jgi:hypothetical protein